MSSVPLSNSKICGICAVEKPLDDFYKWAQGIQGRVYDCKTCRAIRYGKSAFAEVTDLPGEIWKDVFGWESIYQVSSLGRVKRLKNVPRTPGGRLVGLSVNNRGYPRVELNHAPRTKWMEIHVLIAQAFLGHRPSGMHINHIDGIKTNNRIENLEYCTPQENIIHAHLLGLTNPQKGNSRYNAKLVESDIPIIRRRCKDESNARIAKDYNVTADNIGHIRIGKTWKHVV